MKKLVFLILAGSTSCLWADEITLKDGRKVTWKTISDEGDTYEIVTDKGAKVTIKKDDVEKFSTSKGPELLTGATFTFDKKRKLSTVDLLRMIDPKKDALTGEWRLAGGALVANGMAERMTKLQVTAYTTVPEEYDLSLQVERKEGEAPFYVTLPFGVNGKQFSMGFDLFKGSISGLGSIGGVYIWTGPATVPGKVFENKKPKGITIMVRKEAVVVQTDGKDFLVWKADWEKIAVDPQYALQSKSSFGVMMSEAGSYSITRLTLTLPK
jgi:hypothetical protein